MGPPRRAVGRAGQLRRWPAWALYLVGGAMVIMAYYLVPAVSLLPAWTPKLVLYQVLSVSAAVAVVAGVIQHGPPGRGPAELAVPDRPAGERRPALRAGQDGLRRLPRRRPAGLRGGGAPAGGSRHPAGLVLAAVREPAGGARDRHRVRADAAHRHLHDRQRPGRELARLLRPARRRGAAPLDARSVGAERDAQDAHQPVASGPARSS